jgi:hypothetical protein
MDGAPRQRRPRTWRVVVLMTHALPCLVSSSSIAAPDASSLSCRGSAAEVNGPTSAKIGDPRQCDLQHPSVGALLQQLLLRRNGGCATHLLRRV